MSYSREPRWWGIPVRVLVITFLLTLMSFALSLLLGIGVTLAEAKARGVAADLTTAYRDIAFPTAMGVAAVALVVSSIVEIRHYRQSKALSRIARSSS
ncbi:MAG TPA: hypothetical protein VFA89_02985 [Terriglobales bacterium]|nr:hypothetical protein [Terriglobales bacterium]